jgi:polyhydroxyalkanoate synthesis regulator phasin
MAASKSSPGRSRASRGGRSTQTRSGGGNGLANLAEQLANRILKPLGLVVLSRERIQETLDEAAERGRLTRSDANELVTELVRRGRQQTDELLSDLERLLGQGRQRFDTATKRARSSEALDRIVRGADRARRSVAVGSTFPISGYDDLTAGQVQSRLDGLTAANLRKVREYERRHANRKSVLAAIDKALS